MWHQQIQDKLCDLLKQLDVKIIGVCLIAIDLWKVSCVQLHAFLRWNEMNN